MSDSKGTTSSIVILGAGGMLGRAWCALLDARGHGYVSAGREAVDLSESASIARGIPDGTTLVINCAAYTNVDGCETPEGESAAMAINGTGVGALADHCAAIGATLVHYSTDYVFNGQANEPYKTDQTRDPINAYGRSKALGEALIEKSGADYLVLRTSWLYAPWGNNFVGTMLKLGRTKEALKVVNDQRGRPTSCEHLARASLAMIEQGVRGMHHLTDGGECTWYEFAQRIMAMDGNGCRVDPCATDEFPRPAKRPAYSVLDLSHTETAIGPMPSWENNLSDVIQRMESIAS